MRNTLGVGLALLVFGPLMARGNELAPVPLTKGVRGLVTLAPSQVEMDGRLLEWSQAFCTPLAYNHKSPENRAAQFFYMWDDEALYIGLRCLDRMQANPAPLQSSFNGDAVEFYLDTRSGDALRSKDWTTGAIHLYYSPFQGADIKPRWVIRGGIATSNIVLKGVEIAASSNANGYECEFKLPWANFPEFSPKLGAVFALDAELCSGDGKTRTDRTFTYGSPLSVQQPASQGKVELVKAFDPDYLSIVGPASFPFWVDTPWVQPERAQVQGVVAIPPAFTEIVGLVEIRIHDTEGKVVKSIPAVMEPFGPKDGPFVRAIARWSIDEFAPNTYFATARIAARTGKTLTTVAPRMVAEAMTQGR
ncbi:sugar-binding protein [Singulisphaera sp. Ch08]|uniref:Sugar-binding protein n=1 Tax=Singulisphaera sp. Ch08 TaxID=3120278 RepID=A0AAU7C5T1_9BACT